MSCSGNVLVIGDTHIPFEHRNYLDHCNDVKKEYKCRHVFHVGDLVDNHAISAHSHDPDGFSPYNEHKESLKRIKHGLKRFLNAKSV